MPKNTYADEFKADAVQLDEDIEGASFVMIAEDLSISRSTLKNWVYAARKDCGVQPSLTTEGPTDELLRLQKENQPLRSETQKLSLGRDILRKAAKYFAGESTVKSYPPATWTRERAEVFNLTSTACNRP